VIAPLFNGTFSHNWRAEILPIRPMILPRRHHVYPAIAEEVERGALEVLIRPGTDSKDAQTPFLATCALGFRDPATPTGIWSMPDPDWLCAVSGGYAYLIDVNQPERFTFLRYRPVLDIHCYQSDSMQEATDGQQSSEDGLILFVGHHAIIAWGQNGEAWESDRLSWEGITINRIEGSILHGHGWDLMTDKDLPFALDLGNGKRL